MKVRFWGVRGSFATPGAAFLRYGGNTSAVEVTADSGARLLCDLGTGVTELAKHLMGTSLGEGAGQLSILLTHTHIDHIQGLPFFTPFFIRGNHIRIIGGDVAGQSLEQTLQNQLNPHYSPLYGLENLAAGVSVESMKPGTRRTVDGFEVSAAAMPHGAMTTFAFRIEADGESVVFMTDIEHPSSGPVTEAVELARGADLLIHDAMYPDDVYPEYRGWGHSCPALAVAVAEAASVHRLALFHHSPDSTDDVVDDVVTRARESTSVPLFAAAEDAYLPVR